jgi:antitoxin (DNA-binding transcriptional repressor) of toxin-antitoxin stability system
MSIARITVESIRKDFGYEVDESHVVLAKHSVLGTDDATLCEILGVGTEALGALRDSEQYRMVRQYVAMEYAKQTADQTSNWDGLESAATKRLMEKVDYISDVDQLVKIAAVANRATRKVGNDSNVLDAVNRGGRTVITLTDRITRRLAGQDAEEQHERSFSISQGGNANPSFDEVDAILNVTPRPVLPQEMQLRIKHEEPSLAELERELFRRMDGV